MSETYTYHNRERVPLIARPDHFVSRAERRQLIREKFQIVERLSPHSFRVRVSGGDLTQALDRARNLGPAFPDYWIPDYDASFDGASEFLITDRVFVTLHESLSSSELAAFTGKYRTTIDEPGTAVFSRGDSRRFLMRADSRQNPVELVRKLMEKEVRVSLAEHDLNHRVAPQFDLPTDEAYKRQWHLHDVTDARFQPQGSVHAQEAWQALGHFGDPKVVIGVIDGAFDIDHPDLDSTSKIAGFAYFDDKRLISADDPAADRRRLMEGPTSLISHGTACAALAAAGADGQFSVGVAPACRLYLMKLPIDGDNASVIADSQFLAAILHLRDRVDVVTSSWEAIDPRIQWSTDVVKALEEAATAGGRRPGKGIVFFWGAGNSNRPLANQFKASVPVPFAVIVGDRKIVGLRRARTFINNLVGLPNVVHVAASTSQGRRAHYSNHGPGIGLCAPSNNRDPFIVCTAAPGIPIQTAGFNGTAAAIDSAFGGTSAASPIAAGVAALVISANPTLDAGETVSILRQTAERQLDGTSQYPRAGVDCLGTNAGFDVSPVHPFESGIFQPGHADGSWSPWFGFGRVDALKAVTEAAARATGHVGAAADV